MKRLDCSSPATTSASLAAIFGVDPEEVECRCRTLDLGRYADDPSWSFTEALFSAPPPIEPIEVVYVHATRAFPSRLGFIEGILPLVAEIDGIWSDLHTLVRDDCDRQAWAQFRAWVESGDVPYPAHEMVEQFRRNVGDAETQRARRLHQMISDYRERIRDATRWGPVGFLLRAVAMRPSAMAISCAFGHPLQIVEDIAAAYEARFSRDLLTAYLRATQPVLVTFYDVRPGWSSLDVAARYLWRSAQGLESHSLVSFDGGGRAVPPERILNVEVDPKP